MAVAQARAAAQKQDEATDSCAKAIEAVLQQPALAGDANFEAVREELLARAKARPVFFLRAPQQSTHTPLAGPYWKAFEQVKDSVVSFATAYPFLSGRPEVARQIFLREGYLFADTVQLAIGLANAVHLEDLFNDKHLFIHRGGEVLEAELHSEAGSPVYRYTNGEEEGQKATLLLLDRVSADRATLAEPLHRDFSMVQATLGFDRLEVEYLTAAAVVAHLHYGTAVVRTLLKHEGEGRLGLQCEILAASDAQQVQAVRSRNVQRSQVMVQLHKTILTQIAESLPFDEPKTEFGQEDGKLRQEWNWAYRFGRSSFEYNDDKYRVFDPQGRPRVPQVCIDFITDTLERSSGTWYRPRGEPRERVIGRLDLNGFGIENRRNIESFIAFAGEHPQWFTVHNLPAVQRVPFRQRAAFIDSLKQHRSDFQPGDIVVILGLRDDDKEHYHSFFVYDVDPVTQMPIWLASNAGRPRVRVWENELMSAPKRSIKTVIRPRLDWLASVLLPENTQ
ncbi:MAG TPA: hypothetical protein VL137_01205 [Polyangiaceae bacterium]|nr:hypothetical protein [Polyangiaceae bacterium]